jgi:dTDP-4-amino-4,6-dideoxygalactose transaminase
MDQTPDALSSSAPPRAALPFGRPTLGAEERLLLDEVLASGTLTQGPVVKRFEQSFREFTGAPHALATSSCMGALHLSYLALGLRAGDEVIVSAQTHVATAMAVELCGGRCVFVDAEARTGNIDLGAVRAAITPRTRGIAVVHFLGVPVDMQALRAITDSSGLFVIEDCALALGATCHGVHVGLWGDAGAFSFYPVKHITTGEGGMLISRRADVAERAGRMRAFGIDRTAAGLAPSGADYDATAIGLNYRMSELAGALGVCQMRRLPSLLADRCAHFDRLAAELAEIGDVSVLQSNDESLKSAWYCLSFVLAGELADRRDELARRLRAHGVGSSVYYPRPVPLMSVFRERYGHVAGEFPNAERISRQSMALPVGPHLDAQDIEYIADQVREGIAALRG